MGKLAAFARKFNYDFQIISPSDTTFNKKDKMETNFWLLHQQYGWLILRHDFEKNNSYLPESSVIIPEGYYGQSEITKRIANQMKSFKYNFIKPRRYQCLALPNFSNGLPFRKDYLRFYYDSLKYNCDLFSNQSFAVQVQFDEQEESNKLSYIFKYDSNLLSLHIGDHVLVKTHHRGSNKLVEKSAVVSALIPSTEFYPQYHDKVRINILRKFLPVIAKL